MDKQTPNYRQSLNPGQLQILNLLYKFRYSTNDLFAAYFGKKDRSFVHKRMSILLERGLVGKRFSNTYRLHGKPGEYYLTPDGARKLQEAQGIEISIKSIYKDKELSEQFVRYSLELLAIYIQLRRQYGEALRFFTRAILSHEDYDYFPQPLPNAYIRLKAGKRDKQFFLEVLHDDQPWFVAVRKILLHIKYIEDRDWDGADTISPSILLICESGQLAKRVQKRIPKAMKDTYDEHLIEFAVTSKESLFSGKKVIWNASNDTELASLDQLDEWTLQ